MVELDALFDQVSTCQFLNKIGVDKSSVENQTMHKFEIRNPRWRLHDVHYSFDPNCVQNLRNNISYFLIMVAWNHAYISKLLRLRYRHRNVFKKAKHNFQSFVHTSLHSYRVSTLEFYSFKTHLRKLWRYQGRGGCAISSVNIGVIRHSFEKFRAHIPVSRLFKNRLDYCDAVFSNFRISIFIF